MPTDASTNDEIEKLIRDAHDGLLNPHDEEKAEQLFARFYGRGPAQEVLNVGYDPEPDYEWDPDRASWLLEDYLVDIPSRIESLAEGAEPTDQERQWYREAADKEIKDRCCYDVTRVCRLAASEQSSEKRPVFFVWLGTVWGPYSEPEAWIGPLCDIKELAEYTLAYTGCLFEFMFEQVFPEGDTLKEHLQNRSVTACLNPCVDAGDFS